MIGNSSFLSVGEGSKQQDKLSSTIYTEPSSITLEFDSAMVFCFICSIHAFDLFVNI